MAGIRCMQSASHARTHVASRLAPPQATGSADHAFLEILPKILLHARIQFRDVRDSNRRDDLIQEVLAYCLRWARLLWDRGKDVRDFPSALATYAVISVRNGRRICGMAKAKDAMNEHAQAHFGFCCTRLPDFETLCGSELQEALIDNTQTPVDEQVAFRLDFPAWMATLDERRKSLVRQLMAGESTQAVASLFGLSPGRVSQLRQEFHADWQHFSGERSD